MNQTQCHFFVQIPIEARYACPRHSHTCVEIVFSFGAQGWLYDGGKRYRYGNGTAFAYQPGTEHWVENEVAGTHWCLGVSSSHAPKLAVGDQAPSPAAASRLKEMINALQNLRSTRSDRLDLLAGLLVVDLLDATDKTLAFTEKAQDSVVDAARRMIDSRFREPLAITDVAEALYISPEHLRRMFREAFGTSPMHYLIRKRIESAQDLLRMTDLPMHEIALRCGIENPYYFSRLFRNITGITASQYRRVPSATGESKSATQRSGRV